MARVDKNGQVKISGDKIAGQRNPIVEVNLANNKQSDMAEGAKYIRNVIQALQKRDHITKYNFVAHSMGNMDAFSYLNDYGTQSGMPELKKQVVPVVVYLVGHVIVPTLKRCARIWIT